MTKNSRGFIQYLILAIIVIAIVTTAVVLTISHRNKAKVGTTTASASTTSSQTADAYAGWKTYASPFEKLSFKYPPEWQPVSPSVTSSIPNADSFELKSPVGDLRVSWISAVTGIGGACDNTIMPGTAVGPDALGPCSYWYVLDKQKLARADLYYVAGTVTSDGKTYSPWCALQASEGITKDESNIGYLLFKGKNNDFTQSGHDYGLNPAGLMCGRPFGGQGLLKGTDAQAKAFLNTSEMKQAKMILLSTSY